MKITATKLDDLKKARDEYDAELNRLEQADKANTDKWRNAQYEAKKRVERRVADIIGSTPLDIEIRVDPGWSRTDKEFWEIRVTANERKHFDKDIALAWHWKVKLDSKGEIIKDSGSWSGLQAVTDAQLADLEESVRILKKLNNYDWTDVVTGDTVDWNDYHDPSITDQLRDVRNNRPNFEDDLLQAEIEDLINSDIAIKLKEDSYFRGSVGMLLTGSSDKFVKGYIFPWSYATSPDGYINQIAGDTLAEKLRNYASEARRASKDKIVMEDGQLVTKELS